MFRVRNRLGQHPFGHKRATVRSFRGHRTEGLTEANPGVPFHVAAGVPILVAISTMEHEGPTLPGRLGENDLRHRYRPADLVDQVGFLLAQRGVVLVDPEDDRPGGAIERQLEGRVAASRRRAVGRGRCGLEGTRGAPCAPPLRPESFDAARNGPSGPHGARRAPMATSSPVLRAVAMNPRPVRTVGVGSLRRHSSPWWNPALHRECRVRQAG